MNGTSTQENKTFDQDRTARKANLYLRGRSSGGSDNTAAAQIDSFYADVVGGAESADADGRRYPSNYRFIEGGPAAAGAGASRDRLIMGGGGKDPEIDGIAARYQANDGISDTTSQQRRASWIAEQNKYTDQLNRDSVIRETTSQTFPVTVTDSEGLVLASRFASGFVHGAADMVWQPVANTLDLGQAGIGLVSGGSYEPTWLSAIGRNYESGLSYGETVTRAILGSNPVSGIGLSSYDLTSSALDGDWGGVAEGVGGVAGSVAAGKFGQRWAAPQIGAELGIVRISKGSDIESSISGLVDLPGGQAANFKGTPSPVSIGDSPLFRVFDTLDPNIRGAQPNGGYWSRAPYKTEVDWRSGAAVQNDWNAGTYQGTWHPESQFAWGGRSAPQAIEGFSIAKWGFKIGWINKGGDYQIFVPNSRSVIQPSTVITQPAPWRR